MKQAKSISQKILGFFFKSSTQKLAEELIALSDRELQDMGFSRVKLYEGERAFPWKA